MGDLLLCLLASLDETVFHPPSALHLDEHLRRSKSLFTRFKQLRVRGFLSVDLRLEGAVLGFELSFFDLELRLLDSFGDHSLLELLVDIGSGECPLLVNVLLSLPLLD
jgi:hypothetical protein